MSLDRRRTLSAATTASTVVVRSGTGPLGLLGILFVVLKLFELTAVATWSWWLVLLPFYAGFLIALGIWAIILACVLAGLLVGGIIYGVAYLADKWKYRKRRAELKAFGIKRRDGTKQAL